MNENKFGLKQEIGAVGIAANFVNIIVGAGIYILPPLVASFLGEASIIAYLTCGILVLFIMLAFSQLGKHSNESGGAFAYVNQYLGAFPAFLINILFWFGTGVVMNAALINAMADMLSLHNNGYRLLLFMALLVLFAIINIKGVKLGNRFVIANTFIKLTPLILLVMVGLYYLKLENIQWSTVPNLQQIGQASLLLFFAFGGGESALSLGGEIRNPKQNVPIGIFAGLILVLILYISLQLIAQSVFGPALTQHKNTPLADLSAILLGPWFGKVVSFAGIFSIYASLSGSILSYPRVLFGGAQKGWFPQKFSAIHTKYQTPYMAIIAYTVLVFVFAITGQFKTLANLSSASLLLIYMAVVCAALKSNFSKKVFFHWHNLAYILSILGILALLINLSFNEISTMAIAIGIISVIYFIQSSLRKL